MSAQETGEVVVTAVGAVSPVGLSAAATCAALRASVSRFRDHPSFMPRLPEPPLAEPEHARVAFIAPFREPRSHVERLVELALPSMKELMAGAKLGRKDLAATRFFFSLPAANGGRPGLASGQDFLTPCFERLALAPAEPPQVYREGQTGMFTALMDAVKLLRQGTSRFCVLVGVESYLDAASLRWLDETWRLRSLRNVDGFIPGECATAVLLETSKQARARGQPVLARIRGMASATEARTLESDRLSSGQGLVQAIRSAVAAVPQPGPMWTICDLNGESYRAHEWGLAFTRMAELSALQLQRVIWHPSDCLGDIGAASGGLYLAMVSRAFARGYAPSARVLLWASASGGQRTACVVEQPG
jgi:3-oxoacyl-[acyl-carrier-protein] synthase-1